MYYMTTPFSYTAPTPENLHSDRRISQILVKYSQNSKSPWKEYSQYFSDLFKYIQYQVNFKWCVCSEIWMQRRVKQVAVACAEKRYDPILPLHTNVLKRTMMS